MLGRWLHVWQGGRQCTGLTVPLRTSAFTWFVRTHRVPNACGALKLLQTRDHLIRWALTVPGSTVWTTLEGRIEFVVRSTIQWPNLDFCNKKLPQLSRDLRRTSRHIKQSKNPRRCAIAVISIRTLALTSFRSPPHYARIDKKAEVIASKSRWSSATLLSY